MIRHLQFALVATLFLVFASETRAQVVGSGATQLNLSGNLTIVTQDSDGSDGSTGLRGALGVGLTHFLTDRFELGGFTSLLWNDDGDVGGTLFGITRVNLINQSLWVPFFGVGAGAIFVNGEVQSGLSGGVFAGVRRFIGDNVSFNIETSQQFQISEGEFNWGEFKTIPINFGFSVFFGG